tara:strand:+ start:677 stop:1147 length:471 start_codon:yes stop_codon:yes gene_type:complete
MTTPPNTAVEFSKALQSSDFNLRAQAVIALATFLEHHPIDAFDLIVMAMGDIDPRICNEATNNMGKLAHQDPEMVQRRISERLGQKQEWSGKDRTDILLLGVWARMNKNEGVSPVMQLAWRQAHEQQDRTLRGMIKKFAVHTGELPNLKFGSSAIN